MERDAKGLASALSEGQLSDHPLVSMDERGHASMAVGPLSGFFQQANLVAFGVVQVRDATVRPIGGRPQELGSSSGQFGVDLGEVVNAEHEETFGSLPAVPGWTSMDGEPDRPRIEVDHMAFVEEERQSEDVPVEGPRSFQVFRVPHDALHGERHTDQPVDMDPFGQSPFEGSFAHPVVIVK
jgi:hypothetical protein